MVSVIFAIGEENFLLDTRARIVLRLLFFSGIAPKKNSLPKFFTWVHFAWRVDNTGVPPLFITDNP
jgi:hypothetical protein